MSTKAIVYARLSKNPDGTKDSTDGQVTDAKRIAADRGWSIAEVVVEDDRSAFTDSLSRPGFQRVLRLIEAGACDVVVARDVERYARKTAAWLALRDTAADHGVRLATFAGPIDIETADGQFTSTIQASSAELYSAKISQHVNGAFARRRAEGQYSVTGHAPYGFAWVPVNGGNGRTHKELRPVPERVKVLERMVGMILDDGASLSLVARTLTEEGVPTQSGTGRWSPSTISGLLRHRRLIGRYCDADGNDLGPAPWDPIIEPARWTELQATLQYRGRYHQQAHSRALKRWARRKVVCGLCGHAMITSGTADRPQYRCAPPKFGGGCGKVQAVAHGVESAVSQDLIAHLNHPKFRAELAAAEDTPNIDVAKVTAELDALEERMGALGSAFANGDIPLDVLTAATATADAQRRDLRAKLAEATVTRAAPPLPDQIDAEIWEALTAEEKAGILDAVAEQVVIHPASKRNGPKFDPGRVEVVWRT